MTFREKLAHVAKDDPDFARSARNWRIASWLFGIAVVAALAFAVWSLKIGFNNSTKITRIESPCLKYGPDSKQCEEAFSAAVSTITHPQACAIERKAGTLQAIRELAAGLGVEFTEPCAGARIEQERVRGKERAAADRQRAGGDAPTGSTGTLQSGPREGGSSGDVDTGKTRGGGGSGGPRKPPAPAPSAVPAPSPPSASSPGRSADAPGNPEPKADPPGALPSTLEAAGEAVGQVAEGAGKAVEGVGKTGDCALRGSC